MAKIPAPYVKAKDIKEDVGFLPESAALDAQHRRPQYKPETDLIARHVPEMWKPRTYGMDGTELICPLHLQTYTELEKTMEHYPDAAKGKFCHTCGRPVRKDGRTAKRGVGKQKPCPQCGFRRKQELSENARRKGTENLTKKRGAADEYIQNGNNKAPARRAGARLSVSEVLRQRVEEEASMILKPYFEGLAQEPKEEWSPGTKLEFYMNQTQIAEKLLNRTEGMPVARTRHVDKDDEDILKMDELSEGTLVQIVAAIVADEPLAEEVEAIAVEIEPLGEESG